MTSMVHAWIEHTAGTEDRLAVMQRTTSSDCGVGFTDNPAYFFEVPADNPSDSLINAVGTVVSVFTVSGAGTYTFYLNAEMRSGQSAFDFLMEDVTVAVFYPT